MVAMVLAIIVTGAIYHTYAVQTKSYNIQDQLSEMQQNARAAMEMIVRELRMAGFGEAGFTVPDANAVVASNSSAGPDAIMVSDSQGLSTEIPANIAAGSPTITVAFLDPNGDGTNDFFQNAGVIISNGAQTEGFQIIGIDPATNTITLSGTLANSYVAEGTVVVPATIYDVNASRLRRNTDVLAANIDDLQFAYIFDDGEEANAPNNADADDTNDTDDIRSIRINLLARARSGDPDFTGGRPTIEDHAADGSTDQFRRRLLTTVVRLRNMGG
jgi:type IV pilus assembly protein PilW